MGTHPIFESDFDCLTDFLKMSEMETSTLDESQATEERASYEEQIKLVNAISTPMASKKLTKRVFKCAKKALPFSQEIPFQSMCTVIFPLCSRIAIFHTFSFHQSMILELQSGQSVQRVCYSSNQTKCMPKILESVSRK